MSLSAMTKNAREQAYKDFCNWFKDIWENELRLKIITAANNGYNFCYFTYDYDRKNQYRNEHICEFLNKFISTEMSDDIFEIYITTNIGIGIYDQCKICISWKVEE